MKHENGAHKLAIDCIYEALIYLMNRKPYKEITISEITRRAGVSRMAYYRNYADKDSILLRRLELYLQQAEATLTSRQDLSRADFWRSFIHLNQQDPINDYILQAGLFEKSFSLHMDCLMRVYTKLFDLNKEDTSTQMLIYQKLGSTFGYLLYMRDHRGDMDADAMLRHLMRLGEEGV